MENENEVVQQLYNYAAQLIFKKEMNDHEVRQELMGRGADEVTANMIIDKVHEHISDAQSAQAKKDMIYGAMWCIGGLLATFAHLGYVFWGAIIFGGIQFFKGFLHSSD
jgi:hypothetical protein